VQGGHTGGGSFYDKSGGPKAFPTANPYEWQGSGKWMVENGLRCE